MQVFRASSPWPFHCITWVPREPFCTIAADGPSVGFQGAEKRARDLEHFFLLPLLLPTICSLYSSQNDLSKTQIMSLLPGHPAVASLSPRTGRHFSAQPPRAHLIQSHYTPLASRLATVPAHKPPRCFSKMGKSLLPQNFPEHFPPSIPFLWFSHSLLPSSAQLPLPQEDPPRPLYLKQQHPSLFSHSSYTRLELFICLLAHLLADFFPSLLAQRAETSSSESRWYLQSPVPCPAHRWYSVRIHRVNESPVTPNRGNDNKVSPYSDLFFVLSPNTFDTSVLTANF